MKQILLFLLTINISVNVYGQQNKFETGIEGCPSITFFRWNGNKVRLPDLYKNPIINFSSGIYFQYNLPKYFSIYSSINYERKSLLSKGTWIDDSGNFIADYYDKSNFDYITVPLLAKVSIGKKTKLFINAGPFFSYLIKETFVVEVTDLPQLTGDNTYFYKHLDLGVSEGLGVSIPIKNTVVISCEIRNNLGLKNEVKVPRTDFEIVKTNTTYLLLGIGLNLGKR